MLTWLRRALGPRAGLLRMHAPRELRLSAAAPAAGAARHTISLVTPVRNQARYIRATLSSVLSQGYPALEYIVIDGASTDGTRDLVAEVAPRLARFESGADRGQADAINKGFARCSGEIMGWLNGDDLLLPGALHAVDRFFAANPQIDVLYGDRVLVDEDGAEVGRWILPAHSDRVLSWIDFVPQETLFWRRRAWDLAGGRLDDSFRFAMDWDFLVRLRDAGARFAHVPRLLGAFRVHGAQKTAAEITTGFEEMDRIRRRCLGRSPAKLEIALAAAPYLLRQMAVDLRARAFDRVK